MRAFGLAFVVAVLAELGDKTQLLVLALASRYRPLPVFGGLALGTFAVMGASVSAGALLGAALPTTFVTAGAGALFLGFAVWTLRQGPEVVEVEAEPAAARARFVALGVAAAVFVAELGDKTMLAALALGATQPALPTWGGTSAGMLAACSLALLVGNLVGARLPERVVRLGSGGLFALFGLLLLAQALR